MGREKKKKTKTRIGSNENTRGEKGNKKDSEFFFRT